MEQVFDERVILEWIEELKRKRLQPGITGSEYYFVIPNEISCLQQRLAFMRENGNGNKPPSPT